MLGESVEWRAISKGEMVSQTLEIPEIYPNKPKYFPTQYFLSDTPKVPLLSPMLACMREKVTDGNINH